MLAKLTYELPQSGRYLYEPKWDGFRSLAFRSGMAVDMRSRRQSLFSRYFPELVEAFLALPEPEFVLDGEIVIARDSGFDFVALMNRLHPAASRIERLRRETPAAFIAFDLLGAGSIDYQSRPFSERRVALEKMLAGCKPPLYLTPTTTDSGVARTWLEQLCGDGIDGVVAKPSSMRYEPGKRVMLKVKRERTLDCVIGGFRCLAGTSSVASLLLGLHDAQDRLRHVGVVSSFSEAKRVEIFEILRPRITSLEGHPWAVGFGFGAQTLSRLRGAASVWVPELGQDWTPVRPELVCEVTFGQVDNHHLRYPAKFVRWRPDRDPRSCTFDQLERPPVRAGSILG